MPAPAIGRIWPEVKGQEIPLMQVMKVSFPAPKQDGDGQVDADGQMELAQLSHRCQALHYPRISTAVREREKKQEHALMIFAKSMKEREGSVSGNNKVFLWVLYLRRDLNNEMEPARWERAFDTWLLFRYGTPWNSFECLWNRQWLFFKSCPGEGSRWNGKSSGLRVRRPVSPAPRLALAVPKAWPRSLGLSLPPCFICKMKMAACWPPKSLSILKSSVGRGLHSSLWRCFPTLFRNSIFC